MCGTGFKFAAQIDGLTKAKLLYQVTEKFARIDLHPTRSTITKWGSSSRN